MHRVDHRSPLASRPAVTRVGRRIRAGRAPAASRRPRQAERGQGLVEFSLSLVFLTVLLLGVLDIGRAYFTYLGLKDAAEEGAYYGSAFPQCVAVGGIN